MINTILTSGALLATIALAQDGWGGSVPDTGSGAVGTATVINACSYDVHLENTPSSGGGEVTIPQLLSPGGSYSQQYKALTNGNGWSLKLSKDGNMGSNLLQYEYTYHPGEPIWYDLSEVDGNPWDGNWEITATGDCTPRQAAYRFSTDDAYGMQSCPADASITVTVCSGESGGTAPVPSSPAESPYPTSAPVVSAPPAPTSAAPPASSPTYGGWPPADKNVEAAAGDVAEKELPADAWDGPAVTVTNMHYATVTEYVTASPNKRHVHHPRHPHHRR